MGWAVEFLEGKHVDDLDWVYLEGSNLIGRTRGRV